MQEKIGNKSHKKANLTGAKGSVANCNNNTNSLDNETTRLQANQRGDETDTQTGYRRFKMIRRLKQSFNRNRIQKCVHTHLTTC